LLIFCNAFSSTNSPSSKDYVVSCGQTSNQAADAAIHIGIPRNVSKKTFYVGAATVGILAVGGFWLSRRLLRQYRALSTSQSDQTQITSGSAAVGSTKIKALPGQERIEPIPPHKLSGRHCAKCRAEAGSKQGAWYSLQGQNYCQDCAQEKARKAGANLVPPSAEAVTMRLPKFSTKGRRVTLKPAWINAGGLKNLDGYEVFLSDGTRTGLTLTPEVKVDENGSVTINKTRWFVNYDRAGRAIGGPYESLSQARSMALIMAQFNWLRSIEEFSNEELEAITRAANAFRADLEEEKFIKERAALFFS
jgi:hypothetical protein